MSDETAVTSPLLEVTEDDLEKAQSQIALYREMLDAELLEDAPNQNFVGRMETAIEEIQSEARDYYYALNPVPRPELCTLCNYTPTDKNSNLHECPNCHGPFENNTVSPKGYFNWVCKTPSGILYCIQTEDAEEPDIPQVEEI